MERKFLDNLERDIQRINAPEEDKAKILRNLIILKEQKINLMITGATGCGKSSTINALFQAQVAKVGVGVDPETMDITKYELDNLVLWDSPGLGDGKEADQRHAKNIIQKLTELDENGELLIDLVLVILDGSTRDLGTSFELINQVIIPNLGEEKSKRILVAINQADMAMKGRYWNYDENKPEAILEQELEKKVKSVQRRIQESTGLIVYPIYYSAGYKEPNGDQNSPYNLTKLLHFIIQYTPKKKRLSFVDNINTDQEMWKSNDDLQDYSRGIWESFTETISDYATGGGALGETLGRALLGEAGATAGRLLGGAVGAVAGVFKSAFDGIKSLFS